MFEPINVMDLLSPVEQLVAQQVESRVGEDDEGLQEDEEEHQPDVDTLGDVVARRVGAGLKELRPVEDLSFDLGPSI